VGAGVSMAKADDSNSTHQHGPYPRGCHCRRHTIASHQHNRDARRSKGHHRFAEGGAVCADSIQGPLHLLPPGAPSSLRYTNQLAQMFLLTCEEPPVAVPRRLHSRNDWFAGSKTGTAHSIHHL
jgi:hypothetical protein